jgi:hypothetical protein
MIVNVQNMLKSARASAQGTSNANSLALVSRKRPASTEKIAGTHLNPLNLLLRQYSPDAKVIAEVTAGVYAGDHRPRPLSAVALTRGSVLSVPGGTMIAMTDEAFWLLITRAAEQPGDRDEQAEWLTEELTRLPVEQIVAFQVKLSEVRLRADTWPMWAAARVIQDGFCSDDSFWYFQLWLLSLGRATFDRIVKNPDTLAELEAVRSLAARPMKAWSDQCWPDWESLDYAAHEAYQDATGREAGLEQALLAAGFDLPCAPDPADIDWDVAEPDAVAHHLPRLTLLFSAKVAQRAGLSA